MRVYVQADGCGNSVFQAAEVAQIPMVGDLMKYPMPPFRTCRVVMVMHIPDCACAERTALAAGPADAILWLAQTNERDALEAAHRAASEAPGFVRGLNGLSPSR